MTDKKQGFFVRAFLEATQVLRVEAQNWSKIMQLTTQAQIAPMLKQLRVKLASKQATILLDKC